MTIKNIPQSLLDAVNKVLMNEAQEEHPMIEVDGAMKHRLNSLGQPIHHTEEGIKNFHRWFGDSKAVDEHGRPLVVYHGSTKTFSEFDPSKHGKNDHGWYGIGHYLTPDVETASAYATYDEKNTTGANVIPVYAKIKRPYKWTQDMKPLQKDDDIRQATENLKTLGYDGVFVENQYAQPEHVKHYEVVAFHPHQIKSAIGNSGAFSHSTKITESTEHPMIEVDGAMKHRHNSLGQPIHHTEEGIKNFHRWFGDSKAVDEHGRPQVLYHGTNAHAYADGSIERFHTNTERGAAFFSSHPEIAKQYGERLYSTYVRLNNPLIIDGNNQHWSDLSSDSKVSGNITPELHAADEKKTKDLSSIFSDLFGDDDSSSVKRKFGGFTNLNHTLSDITDKTTTDDVAKHAKKLGYDGVIFRNIKDSPVHDVKMYSPINSDIYAVFKSPDVKSTQNSGKFHTDSIITESDEEDYRGSHTAPGPDYGAPAHDLTRDIYPEDFYSSKGARLYGDGRDDDYKVHSQLRTLRNRPEAEVNIYRAVPNDSKITEINSGDWVTTNLQYAHDHGERFDSHKILSKRVKAKEIFTDGNSFHEFGYHPQD